MLSLRFVGTIGFSLACCILTTSSGNAQRAEPVPPPYVERFDKDYTAFRAIVVPFYMHMLVRYFENTPSKTDHEQLFATVLDGDPNLKAALRRAVGTYMQLPLATKKAMFDDDIVDAFQSLTTPPDIDFLNSRLEDVLPQLFRTGPDAPSKLGATNASRVLDPDLSVPTLYAVSLSWTDNASDEYGFRIYRRQLPSGLSAATDAAPFDLIATVGQNIVNFIDSNVGMPANPEDRYCYRITAYRSVAASSGQPYVFESAPTDLSCAQYHVVAIRADHDNDGVSDSSDLCPEYPGFAPHGCDDDDRDGYPDANVSGLDHCPKEWGDPQSPDDTAPLPDPGCPIRYTIRWIGMTVLNNSVDHSSFKAVYNEASTIDDTPGEEPYLLFTFRTGGRFGLPEVGQTRWCCGDDINIQAGRNAYEPDNDSTAEEYPDDLPNIQKSGLVVFPLDGTVVAPIQGGLGLTMNVTLMEEDKLVAMKTAEDAMGKLENIFSLGEKSGDAVKACGAVTAGASAAIASCVIKIGMSVKVFVETILGFSESDPTIVEDPDDLMGTDSWALSRDHARNVTSKTGAYAFSLLDVPTGALWGCVFQPCTIPGGEPLSMRVRLNFCLVRAGIPEDKIKGLCASPSAVLPWPQNVDSLW